MQSIHLKSRYLLPVSFSIIALISVLNGSCVYDSREDVGPAVCDTEEVSYNLTIKPIFENTCLVCHSAANPSGNLNFETHLGVVESVTSGRLIGALKHLDGFTPMPKFSPKLPDCEINKIEKWVNDGALNN